MRGVTTDHVSILHIKGEKGLTLLCEVLLRVVLELEVNTDPNNEL